MLGLQPPRASTAAGAPESAGPRSAEPRSIAVYRDPARAEPAWAALEAVSSASPYQTRRWVTAWLETTGRTLCVTPAIIVAFDSEGLPLALLPLGVQRLGRLRIGRFLGGRDSNINLGLFRPGLRWDRAAILSLLHAGAALSETPIDLFVLRNQPHEWDDRPNPLATVAGQPSPSFAHKVDLERNAEAFLRKLLSKDTRKKLRRKTERLAALGTVEHRVAVTDADREACLDAFMGQRGVRNRELGIATAGLGDLRRFLERASDPARGLAAIEAHMLRCGERIVATFFGTSHRGRFCGMSMSFDSDPELARASPGELLVSMMIESKCRAGLAVFDLGIGEARYKRTYCPVAEPLFDAFVPISALGRAVAAVERLRLGLKRFIKQSPWAWTMAQRLRRGVSRKKGPPGRRGIRQVVRQRRGLDDRG